MNVLIYKEQDGSILDKIQARVHFKDQCRFCYENNLDGFSKQVPSCYAGECIIVFFAGRPDELACLKSVMKKLFDVKLIIGVLNDDTGFFLDALSLHPNFINPFGSPDTNIISVINKMITNHIQNNPGGPNENKL